jgi:hypothetical protein
MEAHAANRSSAIIILFIYYGTGLCLLEWCGAVRCALHRTSGIPKLRKLKGRSLVAALGPYLIEQMRRCDKRQFMTQDRVLQLPIRATHVLLSPSRACLMHMGAP